MGMVEAFWAGSGVSAVGQSLPVWIKVAWKADDHVKVYFMV